MARDQGQGTTGEGEGDMGHGTAETLPRLVDQRGQGDALTATPLMRLLNETHGRGRGRPNTLAAYNHVKHGGSTALPRPRRDSAETRDANNQAAGQLHSRQGLDTGPGFREILSCHCD